MAGIKKLIELPPPLVLSWVVGHMRAVNSLICHGRGSAKALDYTLKRWPSHIRYAEPGHLPTDNKSSRKRHSTYRDLQKDFFLVSHGKNRRCFAIETIQHDIAFTS